MVRRTKEEAEQTRISLLDAAEKVFFRQGVVRTSLQEVASEAGVTRGAIYWHFKDKTDLLDAMAQRAYFPQEDLMRSLLERNSKNPLKDLQDGCEEALHLILRDGQRRRIFTILTQKCEYAADEMKAIMQRRVESKARTLDMTREFFRRSRDLGILAPRWTPEAAAAALHWILVGIINGEMEREPDPKREKEILENLAIFFKSFQN